MESKKDDYERRLLLDKRKGVRGKASGHKRKATRGRVDKHNILYTSNPSQCETRAEGRAKGVREVKMIKVCYVLVQSICQNKTH